MKHETRLSLNARRMTTRELAHAQLKDRLRLPDWYGNNLDALHDCLGEIGKPTRIILRHAAHLERNLGDYGMKLLRVLETSVEENPILRLSIRNWL